MAGIFSSLRCLADEISNVKFLTSALDGERRLKPEGGGSLFVVEIEKKIPFLTGETIFAVS